MIIISHQLDVCLRFLPKKKRKRPFFSLICGASLPWSLDEADGDAGCTGAPVVGGLRGLGGDGDPGDDGEVKKAFLFSCSSNGCGGVSFFLRLKVVCR